VLRRMPGGFPSPMIGMTHFADIILTVLVLLWFLIRYRGKRVLAPLA
jgi:hypothetical protein